MVGMCLSSSSSNPVPMGSSLFPQPLYPWALSLSDTYLPRLCSACFASLTSSPSINTFTCNGPCNGRVAYCSLICRDSDLPLHLYSGECSLMPLISPSPPSPSSSLASDSCDIRLALRLLAFYEELDITSHFLSLEKRRERNPECCAHDPRLCGLMSNRSNLLLGEMVSQEAESISKEQTQQATAKEIEGEEKEREEEVYEFAHELRSHVLLMYKARLALPSPSSSPKHYLQIKRSLRSYAEEMLLLEEVICQVVTNGVHIPVDPLTMLIASTRNSTNASTSICSNTSTLRNHSSPQSNGHLGSAIYGPSFSWINHSCRPNAFYSFLLGNSIVSPDNADCDVSLVPDVNIADDLEEAWGLQFTSRQFCNRYGPRLHLRSICDIQQLAPVFISYIDLLQPRTTRMRELWIKYGFDCKCERCNMTPIGYADNALEKIGVPGCGSEHLENELEDEFEHGLNELMANDDPHSCCKVLECALFKIIRERCKSCFHLRTPPLAHHSCLDIYMVLSSSYKILAGGYGQQKVESNVSDNYGKGNGKPLSPTAVFMLSSVAYRLILAGCVQSFYDSGEVGLIDVTSRSWLECGESIIRALIEIDRCFDVNALSECENFNMCLRSGGDNTSLEKALQSDLERFFGANTRHNDSMDGHLEWSIVEVLKKLVALIWPLFQSNSLFLSSILAPCDSNEIFSIVPVFDLVSNPLTRESWLRHRVPVLLCAMCAFLHSSTLMSTCHGQNEQCMKVFRSMTNFIASNSSKD